MEHIYTYSLPRVKEILDRWGKFKNVITLLSYIFAVDCFRKSDFKLFCVAYFLQLIDFQRKWISFCKFKLSKEVSKAKKEENSVLACIWENWQKHKQT